MLLVFCPLNFVFELAVQITSQQSWRMTMRPRGAFSLDRFLTHWLWLDLLNLLSDNLMLPGLLAPSCLMSQSLWSRAPRLSWKSVRSWRRPDSGGGSSRKDGGALPEPKDPARRGGDLGTWVKPGTLQNWAISPPGGVMPGLCNLRQKGWLF